MRPLLPGIAAASDAVLSDEHRRVVEAAREYVRRKGPKGWDELVDAVNAMEEHEKRIAEAAEPRRGAR